MPNVLLPLFLTRQRQYLVKKESIVTLKLHTQYYLIHWSSTQLFPITCTVQHKISSIYTINNQNVKKSILSLWCLSNVFYACCCSSLARARVGILGNSGFRGLDFDPRSLLHSSSAETMQFSITGGQGRSETDAVYLLIGCIKVWGAKKTLCWGFACWECAEMNLLGWDKSNVIRLAAFTKYNRSK